MSDVLVAARGGRWAVEIEGRETETFDSQLSAVKRGCELACERRTELVILGLAGVSRPAKGPLRKPRAGG